MLERVLAARDATNERVAALMLATIGRAERRQFWFGPAVQHGRPLEQGIRHRAWRSAAAADYIRLGRCRSHHDRRHSRQPGNFTREGVMDTLLRDIALAARTLRRAPAFTLIAAATIALGIGACTAIFSVVNAVLLRPLPYADADRLVLVWGDMIARDVFDFPFPPADFHDLRERGTLFDGLAAVTTFRQTVTGDDGEPEQVHAAGVTTNFFSLLGARISAGRDFTPDDGTPPPPLPAGAPAAGPPPPLQLAGILSHGFWQRRYGGDRSVIGRTIDMGNQRVEIVGVLAPDFEVLFPPGTNVERLPDVYAALRVDFAAGSRINVFLRVIGKLKPGVTLAAAQALLDALASDLRRDFPIKETAGLQFRVTPMHTDLVEDVRPALLALLGAVLFVLLIACANVANLLLVRAAARERELAVRTALGASRWRLVRQLLTESVLLAAFGAVIGVGLASLGIRLLAALQPGDLPRIDAVSIDPVVLAFTAAAAFVAALVFGLVPAVRAARADIATSLRESGRTAGVAGGRTLRSSVVIAEVALSFVLLIGSGLMLRSFAALQRVDPGFDPDGVLTFSAQARGNDAQRIAFMQQVRERIGALSGVSGVAAANPLPLDGGIANARWGPEAAATDPELFQQAQVHFVLPSYFETMRARLLAGRVFTEAENVATTPYVVIDDVLARKAFRGVSPIGKRLYIRVRTNDPEWFEVIGVVAHQRHTTLATEGREALYFVDGQLGHGAANRWVVRTTGDPLALVSRIRAVIAELDPLVAIGEVQPMRALVSRAMAPTRFTLVLIGVFAAVAAFLAGIGLYGVLATVVRQRRAEIGVRMAFGALPARIQGLFVGEGLKLSIIGIGLGIVVAFALTRVMTSMLIGVAPTDPLTFATMAVLFVGIAAVASWLPARRAARLDPARALREE
jgi:putative ABC transport system permease protein